MLPSRWRAALHGASPYPSSFTVLLFDKPDEPQTYEHPITPNHGRGMAWQADAVARCLRDGRTEEARMPWDETVLQHELFDAIVRSGGLTDEIAKLAWGGRGILMTAIVMGLSGSRERSWSAGRYKGRGQTNGGEKETCRKGVRGRDGSRAGMKLVLWP
jgi:hypothetical protein